MKKLLAIVALIAFLGGMSAPLMAKDNASLITISLNEEDPKKEKKAEKKASKSADAKTSDCAAEKKSSDCSTEKSAKKSSDCGAEKTAKKSSDCSKKCG